MAFLEIEEISESQAAKYITHNGAVRKLRILAQLSVIDNALAAPPASPASGDAYIVAAGATGAWAGWAGKVAFWSDYGWTAITPAKGWRAFVQSLNAVWQYSGTAWAALESSVNALDDLTDVALATPSAGQVLTFDGTNWVNQAAAGASAQPVLFPCFYPGTLTASALMAALLPTVAVTFPAGLTGSRCKVGVNPTATAVLSVRKNGSEVATVTISTSGGITFAASSALTVTTADELTIVGPSTLDATLADVRLTLHGTR